MTLHFPDEGCCCGTPIVPTRCCHSIENISRFYSWLVYHSGGSVLVKAVQVRVRLKPEVLLIVFPLLMMVIIRPQRCLLWPTRWWYVSKGTIMWVVCKCEKAQQWCVCVFLQNNNCVHCVSRCPQADLRWAFFILQCFLQPIFKASSQSDLGSSSLPSDMSIGFLFQVLKAYFSVVHCRITQPVTLLYKDIEFYLGSVFNLALICPIA